MGSTWQLPATAGAQSSHRVIISTVSRTGQPPVSNQGTAMSMRPSCARVPAGAAEAYGLYWASCVA